LTFDEIALSVVWCSN